MLEFAATINGMLAVISWSSVTPPSVERQPGDIVLTTITDEYLKRFWQLLVNERGKYWEVSEDARNRVRDFMATTKGKSRQHPSMDHDPLSCDMCKLVAELKENNYRLMAMENLFWAEIRGILTKEKLILLYCRGQKLAISKNWEVFVGQVTVEDLSQTFTYSPTSG